MKIAALVAVCDDDLHCLRNCLNHLVQHCIDFVVIDDTSGEDVASLLGSRPFSSALIGHVRMQKTDTFSLVAQLELKAEIVEAIDADWVIHLDVDEIMHPYTPNETLREAILRLDRAGFNVINFEEFVFLPIHARYDETVKPQSLDVVQPYTNYYYFEPNANRLMRAWKRSTKASNTLKAGHRLDGDDLRIAPESFALRHYIFRDQEHALKKYQHRTFDSDEVARGWHHNRIGIANHKFLFPPITHFESLATPFDRNLSRTSPAKVHYWEWPQDFQPIATKDAATNYGCPS